MASPSEKLAESLEGLHELQERGIVAIRSGDLTRTHRERLCKNGFLQEVIKGWYIPTRPDETAGESTTWYTSFWNFCAAYLQYLKRYKLVFATGTITIPTCRELDHTPSITGTGKQGAQQHNSLTSRYSTS